MCLVLQPGAPHGTAHRLIRSSGQACLCTVFAAAFAAEQPQSWYQQRGKMVNHVDTGWVCQPYILALVGCASRTYCCGRELGGPLWWQGDQEGVPGWACVASTLCNACQPARPQLWTLLWCGHAIKPARMEACSNINLQSCRSMP